MVVVVLDFILAVLYGFAGIASILLVRAAKQEGSTGMLGNLVLVMAMFFLVIAAAYFVLGLLIKGGSNGARVTQIVLCGLAILLGLYGLMSSGIDVPSLIGLALNILIVAMLMSREASMFFADASGMGSRGRSARGSGRRRGRRRRY